MYFLHPINKFLQRVKKFQIWSRFSTAVAFMDSGFKTEELIGNLILPLQQR